jgi:DNA-dependent RNA polymerase auxiliary subunit epsilon
MGKKRERLLKDKIKWMIEFIENYLQSFYEYKSKQEDMRW